MDSSAPQIQSNKQAELESNTKDGLWTKTWRWLRQKLFPTPLNALLSLFLLCLIALAGYQFLSWAVLDATWLGDSKQACSASTGACWAFIRAKLVFFLFGFYPSEQLWRPALVLGVLAFGIYWLFRRGNKSMLRTFVAVCLLFPLVVFVVLRGWGAAAVSPDYWGGLLLTLILSAMGVLFSFPFGLGLALLRTGKMRILRPLVVLFIECFRGIPLITLLFMSAVVLPMFFPSQVQLPKLLRLVLGLTIFQSVYLAEVIRGGLQAIGKEQYEAAYSLGMSEWVTNYFIVLPQAIRLSLANITSITIAFVKDTSLVLIVGWFDLLGIVKPLSSDSNWLGMEPEGYLFVGILFWVLCALISRLGLKMEQRFNRYMVARH